MINLFTFNMAELTNQQRVKILYDVLLDRGNTMAGDQYAMENGIYQDAEICVAYLDVGMSINKVLDVKTNAINNNVRLTETSKLQANCREYSKEMENMLLPKLKQNLQTLKPGSEKYKQVQENIATMTEMTKKFKQIGSHTGDPSEILAIERQIYMDTGGKSVSEVMNDVKNGFELSIP